MSKIAPKLANNWVGFKPVFDFLSGVNVICFTYSEFKIKRNLRVKKVNKYVVNKSN